MDVLLTDAHIVTMTASAGSSRSMLVRDDRVVAVGPAERMHAAAAPDARVVRLEGRPSFRG